MRGVLVFNHPSHEEVRTVAKNVCMVHAHCGRRGVAALQQASKAATSVTISHPPVRRCLSITENCTTTRAALVLPADLYSGSLAALEDDST